MNIIIAIFLYLGLTYPGDTITEAEYVSHQTDIEATKSDPEFLLFYSTLPTCADGISIFDDQSCE